MRISSGVSSISTPCCYGPSSREVTTFECSWQAGLVPRSIWHGNFLKQQTNIQDERLPRQSTAMLSRRFCTAERVERGARRLSARLGPDGDSHDPPDPRQAPPGDQSCSSRSVDVTRSDREPYRHGGKSKDKARPEARPTSPSSDSRPAATGYLPEF